MGREIRGESREPEGVRRARARVGSPSSQKATGMGRDSAARIDQGGPETPLRWSRTLGARACGRAECVDKGRTRRNTVRGERERTGARADGKVRGRRGVQERWCVCACEGKGARACAMERGRGNGRWRVRRRARDVESYKS